MPRVPKILIRINKWHLWASVGLLVAWSILNLSWTIAILTKPATAWYEGYVIPKLMVQKQSEIIELQYALILELKAEYGTLKVAYTQEKAEKESLEADIYATLNPWFKAMDAEIHIVNGKLLIEGPNGLRSVH